MNALKKIRNNPHQHFTPLIRGQHQTDYGFFQSDIRKMERIAIVRTYWYNKSDKGKL